MLALFGAFLAVRVAIVLGGKVFTSYDTYSYALRGDPVWDRGPLVSLTGHAPRPWGAPIFFAMFSDDHSRAVGQWAVGTLCWAFLALSLSLCMRTRVARLLAAGGILLLGLLRPVISWDFAILSESLSISLGVLTLGLLLWWMRTKALWAAAAMTAAAIWWTFTRLDMLPMLLALVAALAFYAWLQRKSRNRTLIAAMVSAGVLALTGIWSYAITPTSVHTLEQWSFTPDMTHEQGLLMYRLRLNVFPDPQVKAVFEGEFGMPGCAGAERVSAGPTWAVDEFAAEVRKCPELAQWAQRNSDGLWLRYATTAPGLFTRQIGQLTGESLAGAAYAETPTIVPGRIEKLAFPRSHTMLLTLSLLALTLLLALATGAHRQHPQLFLTYLVLVLTALASAVATVVLGTGEVWRFGLQEAIVIRIAVIIAVAGAADSLILRRSRPIQP